ncbi:hypothetical protein AB0I02_31015 [Streptomyces phaeochromogenes]
MSDVEGPGRDARRQAETWASATDNAQVYQSGGAQYIANLNFQGGGGASEEVMAQAGAHSSALERTQERVGLLIRTLSLTQAEWQARCAELAGEARRARAEGRAQALAEAQEQLRAAEDRVIRAQRMMREAELARERTEALLTEAQRELALRRRAEERREEEQAQGTVALRTDQEAARALRLDEEGEQFTELLERAEAELGAVHDDLRSLGEELTGQSGGDPEPDARVIEGLVVRQAGPGEGEAADGSTALQGTPLGAQPPFDLSPHSGVSLPTSAPTSAPRKPGPRTPVPGPPRRWLIGVAWVVSLIPPCVPMFVVTTNRAEYATDPTVGGAIAFTAVTVLVGVLLYLLTLALAALVLLGILDRDSEVGAGLFGAVVCLGGSLVLLVASFWTPLALPGPAGQWGRALASAVGWG